MSLSIYMTNYSSAIKMVTDSFVFTVIRSVSGDRLFNSPSSPFIFNQFSFESMNRSLSLEFEDPAFGDRCYQGNGILMTRLFYLYHLFRLFLEYI